jgi:hypothetical protein
MRQGGAAAPPMLRQYFGFGSFRRSGAGFHRRSRISTCPARNPKE